MRPKVTTSKTIFSIQVIFSSFSSFQAMKKVSDEVVRCRERMNINDLIQNSQPTIPLLFSVINLSLYSSPL